MRKTLVNLDNIKVILDAQTILQEISFSIIEEEIVTIVGPNGAGKSTLIKLILGLITPTSGLFWKQPKIHLGYVPQKIVITELMPLTVKRFLTLSSPNYLNFAQELKIDHLLSRSIHSLSGGQLQRVLLTRSLLDHPQLLLLDEPTQGMDLAGQLELYELLQTIHKQYKTSILLVSHDLHLVMAETTRVICINKHICCQGEPKLVLQDPKFLELFGKALGRKFALYQHSHNHKHDSLEQHDS